MTFDEHATALRPRLLAYLIRQLRNREDAEDVLQEAMLSAWLHYNEFRGDSTFRTWFFAILHNQLIETARRAHARCRRGEHVPLYDVHGILIDRESELHSQVLRQHIALVAPLNEQHFYEGASVRELALQHGRKVATIKTRLLRERRKIKNCSKTRLLLEAA